MFLSIDETNNFKTKPYRSCAASIRKSLVVGWSNYEPVDAINLIINGHSYSGGHFNGDTKTINWQGQQVFSADVDDYNAPNPDEAIDVIKDLFGVPPLAIYRTFSSAPDNNKYRVLVAAPEVITKPLFALAILRGLTHHLAADSACVDLARVIYGTTPDKLHCFNPKAVVSTEALASFANNFVKQTHRPQALKIYDEQCDDLSKLTHCQIQKLTLQIKFEQRLLKNTDLSRYTKLKNCCLGLMKLGFLSSELALYVVQRIVSEDEDLEHYFFDDYDKDYLSIAERNIRWCEETLNG